MTSTPSCIKVDALCVAGLEFPAERLGGGFLAGGDTPERGRLGGVVEEADRLRRRRLLRAARGFLARLLARLDGFGRLRRAEFSAFGGSRFGHRRDGIGTGT
jgi:hypothetical protein